MCYVHCVQCSGRYAMHISLLPNTCIGSKEKTWRRSLFWLKCCSSILIKFIISYFCYSNVECVDCELFTSFATRNEQWTLLKRDINNVYIFYVCANDFMESQTFQWVNWGGRVQLHWFLIEMYWLKSHPKIVIYRCWSIQFSV